MQVLVWNIPAAAQRNFSDFIYAYVQTGEDFTRRVLYCISFSGMDIKAIIHLQISLGCNFSARFCMVEFLCARYTSVCSQHMRRERLYSLSTVHIYNVTQYQ